MKKIRTPLMAVLALLAAPAYANMPNAMPNTRVCTANDVTGAWKMVSFFEQPESPQTAEWRANPQRYTFFNRDQTFTEIIGKTYYGSAAALQEALRAQFKKRLLEQYVLTPKGIIYLYVNRKPIGGYYCRIVVAPRDGFKPGDMLLRTAEQGGKIQVMEHYARPVFNPPPRLQNNRAPVRPAFRGNR